MNSRIFPFNIDNSRRYRQIHFAISDFLGSSHQQRKEEEHKFRDDRKMEQLPFHVNLSQSLSFQHFEVKKIQKSRNCITTTKISVLKIIAFIQISKLSNFHSQADLCIFCYCWFFKFSLVKSHFSNGANALICYFLDPPLPAILRVALLEMALPSLLVALQQYTPASDLSFWWTTLRKNSFPPSINIFWEQGSSSIVFTCRPSWYQVMVGRGLPSA